MKQIRNGVFETNSSSTHSLTIASQEEYDKWEKGELLIDSDSMKFINASEKDKQKYPEDYLTYDEYYEDMEMETFEESHTTKSGDKIVVFGHYGYNG